MAEKRGLDKLTCGRLAELHGLDKSFGMIYSVIFDHILLKKATSQKKYLGACHGILYSTPSEAGGRQNLDVFASALLPCGLA